MNLKAISRFCPSASSASSYYYLQLERSSARLGRVKNVQKKFEVFDSNKKPSFANVVRRNLTDSRSHDASENVLQKGSTNKISLDRNFATSENNRPFSSKLAGNPGGVLGQVLASAAPETAARGMLRHKIADPSQVWVTQISGDYRGLRYKSGLAVLNPVTTMQSQSEGREICTGAMVVKNDSISLGGQN